MPTFNSQDFNVYWLPEETFGTIPDTTAISYTWMPFLEVASVSGRGTQHEVKQIKRLGTRKRAGSPRGKKEEDTFSIELYMTDNQTISTNEADVFDAFLNKATQPFDHTYNKAQGDDSQHVAAGGTTPASYTLLVVDDSDGTGSTFEYYYGCVLSEVEISIEEGEVVMITLNFERKGSDLTGTEKSTGTHSYGTYPSTVAYVLWSDVTITKEAASGWTTTGQILNASSFSATITQNAEKKFRISGSNEPEGIDLVGYEVSGSMDFDYDNLDEADEIIGDKRGDLVVVFGSSGQIDFDVVTFEGFPMDASPDELMTASVDWTCDTVTYTT